ncbi:MAG: hypothetical protein UW71_C0005G0025 [Parcubacteria group bacterium GW2011_GWB1_44_7]|nr:MAG: hypothetical protein UW71_C0005G0025 [Parcubacteria group bacterium GW2011_GWB1_44_7]
MSSNKKNLIIIFIAVVLVAIAVGVAYYFFFMKGETGEPAGTTPTLPVGPTGGLPSTPTGGTGAPATGVGTKVIIPRLRQITKEPVGGAGIFDVTNADKTQSAIIRYIQRADGNIFETKTDTLTVNRISNKTIPKIYEAIWASSGGQTGAGDLVITRQLKDDNETIESFAAKLSGNASSTEKELSGVYLPQRISALAISPDKSKLFYLYPTGAGAGGILSDAYGSKKTLIFESPLSEWLADFADNKTLVLTTKPTASAAGFSYFLNTGSGEIKKIIGNVAGLTILVSPNQKLALYSESVAGSFRAKIYDLVGNRAADFYLQTLPEKCVWSRIEPTVVFCAASKTAPTGNYPDSWYQGLVFFNDDIWKINTATGETNRLISPESFVNKTIDVVNPLLNENESFLLFMNKIDLSLWVLDVR